MPLDDKTIKEFQELYKKEYGKEWFYLEPWYKFVDSYEALKGNKIMDHLEFVRKEDRA